MIEKLFRQDSDVLASILQVSQLFILFSFSCKLIVCTFIIAVTRRTFWYVMAYSKAASSGMLYWCGVMIHDKDCFVCLSCMEWTLNKEYNTHYVLVQIVNGKARSPSTSCSCAWNSCAFLPSRATVSHTKAVPLYTLPLPSEVAKTVMLAYKMYILCFQTCTLFHMLPQFWMSKNSYHDMVWPSTVCVHVHVFHRGHVQNTVTVRRDGDTTQFVVVV
jgi:hypothetical protein